MARPRAKERELIALRNTLIIEASDKYNRTQSEIAFIFRIPRNTVHTVISDHFEIKYETE